MKFTKMQACGNDYSYINCYEEFVRDPRELALKLADRDYGIGSDGISYTEPGKAWFDDEDFCDLMDSDELEFPHDIVGRKLRLAANGAAERDIGDEDEEISLIDKIPDGDYKDFLSNSENRLMLNSAIEQLPQDLREILILNYYNDQTQREIAERFGMSVMQVSRKIKKALNTLYKIVKESEK